MKTALPFKDFNFGIPDFFQTEILYSRLVNQIVAIKRGFVYLKDELAVLSEFTISVEDLLNSWFSRFISYQAS